MRCLFIAALSFFIHSSLLAEHLRYSPGISILGSSKISLEIQESLPVLNLATKANQLLKWEIILKNQGKLHSLSQLPFSMTFILRDLFIFMNVNGKELTFDPRGKKVSIPLIQLGQLINQPIELEIDSFGQVKNSGAFTTLFKELPALKELSLQHLFNEIFFNQFALCGEELAVGATFEKKFFSESYLSMPSQLNYEITAINEQEIHAKMNGILKPQTVFFDFPGEGKENFKKIEMSVTGILDGNIVWNRNNALIYTLNSRYQYSAEMKTGDMKWKLKMTLSHLSTNCCQ